jgi:hypothetical protein
MITPKPWIREHVGPDGKVELWSRQNFASRDKAIEWARYEAPFLEWQVKDIADRILAMINSSPRTPTRDEIANAIGYFRIYKCQFDTIQAGCGNCDACYTKGVGKGG